MWTLSDYEMDDTLETIADRLRSAGAVFSIHQPPLTSVSYIQPISQSILDDITRMTTVRELFLGGSGVTDSDVESWRFMADVFQ